MQLEKRFVVLRWLRGSADWLEEKKEPNLSSLHRLPLVILVALELIHIIFSENPAFSRRARQTWRFAWIAQSHAALQPVKETVFGLLTKKVPGRDQIRIRDPHTTDTNLNANPELKFTLSPVW